MNSRPSIERALTKVRGGQVVGKFQRRLEKAHNALPFKALLMGHPGNGKSTELSRLTFAVEDRYVVYRFSVKRDLDPGAFRPFDVLALLLVGLAEQAAKPVADGGIDFKPPDSLIQRVVGWFSATKIVKKEATATGASATASIGLDADTWWAKLMGLSAQIKGEMRYAAERNKEVVEYQLQRLSSLIDLLNELLDLLREEAFKRAGKDWLIIGEDFDSPGIDPSLVQSFFVTYANVLNELRVSYIFTLPVSLAYSEYYSRLPCPPTVLYDTPVYGEQNQPHAEGRKALREIIEARVVVSLFAPGELDRMLVASDGNLRDLFSLVRDAADSAESRAVAVIEDEDATAAINKLRHAVRSRLGQGSSDDIGYDAKAERLKAIYSRAPKANMPDKVLSSLLRSRSVQEFNGKGRLGIPPLVVDLLIEQGVLATGSAGGTLA